MDGIKEIIQLSTKSKSCLALSRVLLNGNIYDDPVGVATAFNKYFSSVGESLDRKIPQPKHNFKTYLKIASNQSMFFSPVTPGEVASIINSLQTSNAHGPNSVPTRLLKIDQHAISSHWRI